MAEAKKRKRLPLKKRLTFGLIMALLLVSCTEGGLRLAGFPKGVVKSFSKLWNRDGRALAGPFRPGRHKISYPSDLAYEVGINEQGLRGPALSVAKAEGTKRVLCLGDSVTFGYYVEDPDTYPARLRKLLAQENPKLEVINAGCGHFSLPDEIVWLKDSLLKLEPDVVVLQFCNNDLTDREFARSPTLYETIRAGDKGGVSWVRQTAVGEVQLMAAIRFKEWSKRRKGEWPPKGFGGPEELPEDAWKRYGERFRELKALLAEKEIPLVVVGFVDLREAEGGEAKQQDALAELCSDEDVPFAPLLPRYRAVKDKTSLYHFPYDPHANGKGNQLLAEAVAELLRAEDLVE